MTSPWTTTTTVPSPLPIERTAVFGVSARGELALTIGLRHPDVYGAVFCASPGAGYRPPDMMPLHFAGGLVMLFLSGLLGSRA